MLGMQYAVKAVLCRWRKLSNFAFRKTIRNA
jgi:hypothetical protein